MLGTRSKGTASCLHREISITANMTAPQTSVYARVGDEAVWAGEGQVAAIARQRLAAVEERAVGAVRALAVVISESVCIGM